MGDDTYDLNQQMADLSFRHNNQKSGYIPSHLRGRAYAQDNGNKSTLKPGWKDGYSDYGSGGRGRGRPQIDERGSYGGYQRKETSQPRSFGYWRDGVHHIGHRVPRIEQQLFGLPEEVTHTGINFDKYDDIPVEVSGKDTPAPIDKFTSPPIDPHLLSNIELAKYTTPTPVQKYSIPIVMSNRDLMACAQTGSGKTGGFLFPVLSSLFERGQLETEKDHRAYPQALILAPTRELSSQIFDEAKKFAYRSWVRPCVVYGGSDINYQLRQIDRGCDVLVATPGRLVDLLERSRISLSKVQYLVLDEADRMLDMGFEPQIRRIVEGEDMSPVDQRQTLMFSATFPRNIQMLARDFLKEYVFLSVGRVGATSENITQKIEYVEEDDKRSVLLDILTSNPAQGLTLIFVATRKMADALTGFLLTNRFYATSIHGDRSQRDRENALEAFRTGRAPIMVATAVAARGLDIPNVTHVISYDLPTDIDDYVHRIGRTGRAGNTGLATAFLNRGNKPVIRDLVNLLREANQEVPPWLESIVREMWGNRGGVKNTRGAHTNITKDIRKHEHQQSTPRGGYHGGYRGGYRGGYNGGYNQQEYNNQDYQSYGGQNQGVYQQGGFNQEGYYQGGYNGGYNQGGHYQDGYQQGGYHQGGYHQGGYHQGGYHQGIYQQGIYQHGGYQYGGYVQGNYGQGHYGQRGYHQKGYSQGVEGYNVGYSPSSGDQTENGDNTHPEYHKQAGFNDA